MSPLMKHGIDGQYEISEDGCWVWQGSRRPDGYGLVRRANVTWSAHRYSWTLANGEIPQGLTVDHLCFNPPCVNPDHLRLLTLEENSANRRPMRRRGDYCKHGHEFTPENTILRNGTWRSCRECSRISGRRRWAEKRAEIEAEMKAGA